MTLDLSTAGPTLLALVSAVALALVNSWITARAGIDEELRAQRLTAYPPLWEATSLLSRWPRNDVSREALEDLHREMRGWYYDTGGLFLSERSRARYGEVQELAGALLGVDAAAAATLLPTAYADLMDTASSLRTALTQDLDTRRRTTLVERARRLWWHRRAAREFQGRLRRAVSTATLWAPEST